MAHASFITRAKTHALQRVSRFPWCCTLTYENSLSVKCSVSGKILLISNGVIWSY